MLYLIQVKTITSEITNIGDWCAENISGWAFGRDVSLTDNAHELYNFTYNDKTWEERKKKPGWNINDKNSMILSILILNEEDAMAARLKWE